MSRRNNSPCKALSPEAPIILVDGVRAAAVDKRHAALFIGSPKLIERMLWAARHQPHDPWIEIAHNHEGHPKTTTLIDARSLEKAYARLRAGEEPPTMSKLGTPPRLPQSRKPNSK